MTTSDYAEWRRYHCTLLCIHHADYDAMLGEMEQLLLDRNVTLQELDAASEWIWEDAERADRKWSTHGGMIVGHLMRARAKQAEIANREKLRAEEEEHKRRVFAERAVAGKIGKEQAG